MKKLIYSKRYVKLGSLPYLTTSSKFECHKTESLQIGPERPKCEIKYPPKKLVYINYRRSFYAYIIE